MENNYEFDGEFDDDESELNTTPTQIIDYSKAVEGQLLPPKSLARYERMYNNFIEWKKQRKTTSNSERNILAYFGYLANEKKFKPTTLYSYHSMLQSTLNVKENEDISKYAKVLAFLKRQSDGYQPTRARSFTETEMEKFLKEAPDHELLDVKVVCVFGMYGACRTIEFVDLLNEHVKRYPDMFVVELPNTKTKIPRQFVVNKQHYRWEMYKSSYIGKTKFSQMPRRIATFLGLPESDRYTGHAFRRTSASILSNTGQADESRLMKHGGWKSGAVAQQYVDTSLAFKRETAELIGSAITSGNTADDANVNQQVDVDDLNIFGIPPFSEHCENKPPIILSQVVTQMNKVVNTSPVDPLAVEPSTSDSIFRFSNCSGTKRPLSAAKIANVKPIFRSPFSKKLITTTQLK